MLPDRPSAPDTAPSSVETKLTRSHARSGGAAYTARSASSSSSAPVAGRPDSLSSRRMRAVCLTTLHPVPASLVDRSPRLDRDRLVRDLVPPPRFDAERFDTYRPDPQQPSQSAAVERLRGQVDGLRAAGSGNRPRRGWFGRSARSGTGRGIYLDGGFGVGKTH